MGWTISYSGGGGGGGGGGWYYMDIRGGLSHILGGGVVLYGYKGWTISYSGGGGIIWI